MSKREDLLKAAQVGADVQRKKLVVNFDDAYDEYKKGGNEIEIVFEGNTYLFPSEPSAEVMAYILRRGSKMTNEMGMELLQIIIGDEFLDAISKSKAPFLLIVDKVLNPILSVYGFGGAQYKPDESEGKDLIPDS